MAPRLELMSLGKVRSALRNPKAHDMEGIKTSIRRFGFKDFPTINEATLRLVEGHGRLLALKAIKKEGPRPRIDASWPPENIIEKGRSWLCPVVRGQSWKDAAEAVAYLTAHNQLTMASGWGQGLADLFREVANSEHAFEGLGFEGEFVRTLMETEGGSALTPPSPTSTASDDMPAVPAKPKTKLGDIWVLGVHRLICGDGRNAAVVARLLEDRDYINEVDVTFDPTMGAGTTLVAAETEGRVAVGCELSPGHCDVIVERWEVLTGRVGKRAPKPRRAKRTRGRASRAA